MRSVAPARPRVPRLVVVAWVVALAVLAGLVVSVAHFLGASTAATCTAWQAWARRDAFSRGGTPAPAASRCSARGCSPPGSSTRSRSPCSSCSPRRTSPPPRWCPCATPGERWPLRPHRLLPRRAGGGGVRHQRQHRRLRPGAVQRAHARAPGAGHGRAGAARRRPPAAARAGGAPAAPARARSPGSLRGRVVVAAHRPARRAGDLRGGDRGQPPDRR